MYGYSEAEQALREWTTAQRAAFALKQRVERQRWEAEVLAPAQERIVAEIQAGQAPVLELPEGLLE
ncbi:MAG TPA: hypothetical protein VFG50_13255 [Rhodothermales bacterium]|nr:hypothetical protein [Rhodothermales bacterium]